MATYQSAKVAPGTQARAGIDITAASATFTLAVALATNDVIEMVRIPKGATILELAVSCTSLGGNGTLDLGDGASTARFISGTAIPGAGGVARANAHTGLAYTYPAEDTIDVKVASLVSPVASGSITVAVIYQMQQ